MEAATNKENESRLQKKFTEEHENESDIRLRKLIEEKETISESIKLMQQELEIFVKFANETLEEKQSALEQIKKEVREQKKRLNETTEDLKHIYKLFQQSLLEKEKLLENKEEMLTAEVMNKLSRTLSIIFRKQSWHYKYYI